MGLKKELWTGQLIDNFRFFGTWANGLRQANEYVGNNVIHLAQLGVDPAVLIDNAVYPIAVNSQTDTDYPVSLKKLDTENTKITEDELYALPYDKVGSTLNKHRRALELTAMKYGLYTIAPSANTAGTPVLKTTGGNSADGARKTLTVKDVADLKLKFDLADIPREGRRLVLCPEHVNDLLATSESFRNQYVNNREGTILRLYGFDIYEDSYSPKYNTTTLARMAFGATPTTEKEASVAFYAPDVFTAIGDVKMYVRLAELDPENRQTVAGFRMYHIMMPQALRSQGAIVSDAPA